VLGRVAREHPALRRGGPARVDDAAVGVHACGGEFLPQLTPVRVVAEHGDELGAHAERGQRGGGAGGATGRGVRRPGVRADLHHRHGSVAAGAVGGAGDPAVQHRVADDEHAGRLPGDPAGQLVEPARLAVRAAGRVGEQADHGHDGSTEGVTISSRTSQPGGRVSANRTVSATARGSLSIASGPGRYCSVRPSKNAVFIPPGTSIVTPTSPASSTASARLSPTTPNLAAQ
jgi:hypothetical protein